MNIIIISKFLILENNKNNINYICFITFVLLNLKWVFLSFKKIIKQTLYNHPGSKNLQFFYVFPNHLYSPSILDNIDYLESLPNYKYLKFKIIKNSNKHKTYVKLKDIEFFYIMRHPRCTSIFDMDRYAKSHLYDKILIHKYNMAMLI